MAGKIIPTPEWSEIDEISETDVVKGGPEGKANSQARALGNRTEFLQEHKADQSYVDSTFAGLSFANKTYATLAAANADIANIAVNQSVWVSSEAEGGLYEKKTAEATSLTKSAYDPVVQANNYSDENKSFNLSVALMSGENFITEDQAKNDVLYFTGNLTSEATVIFPKKSAIYLIQNFTSGGLDLNIKTLDQVNPAIKIKPAEKSFIFNVGTEIRSINNLKADLRDPVFLGIPKAPTASVFENSTQIATTAFVKSVNGVTNIAVNDDTNAFTVENIQRPTMRLSGTLTKDITIAFPSALGNWDIINATTGGFAVSLKASSQTSNFVRIPSGTTKSVYVYSGVCRELFSNEKLSLPIANNSTLGGVKVGDGLNINDDGVLSVIDGSVDPTTSDRSITTTSINISAATGNLSPKFLSRDGMTCFNGDNRYLKTSTDFGKTWSSGNIGDFGAGPITWVRQTNDGELLVCHQNTATTPNTFTLRKTTGFNPITLTGHTWSIVHTVQRPGINLQGSWGFSQHNNIVIVSEYGAKTGVPYGDMPNGAEVGQYARYVYWSKDFGKTWSILFDLDTVTDGVGVHMHGVCFDPYWNRILVSHGDGSYGTNGLYYSDDFGKTWLSAVSADVQFKQTVHIVALPTCILFASDSGPNGIYRIDRKQGKSPDGGYYNIDLAYRIPDSADTLNHLCHSVFRAEYLPDMPYIFGFGAEVLRGKSCVVATFDGWTYTTVWLDDVDSSAGRGVRTVIGPTYENEVIVMCNDESSSRGTWYEVRAKVDVD